MADGPTGVIRGRLSRDLVLRAAVELADAGGIGALSMRRLARELGVEAMSLYHHVANKDEILDGILDRVVTDMALPERGTDWRSAIRAAAISAYEVLGRHPWAAGLLLTGPRVSAARLRHMDALLGCLREAGFTATATDRAYHALDSHIMGFTLWETGIAAGLASMPGSVAGFLDTLPVEDYPHLAEHIRQHLLPHDPDDDGTFAFGLDLILDSLDRLLARSR